MLSRSPLREGTFSEAADEPDIVSCSYTIAPALSLHSTSFRGLQNSKESSSLYSFVTMIYLDKSHGDPFSHEREAICLVYLWF